MRVRQDRMLRHYNDGTYRRIEAEISREQEAKMSPAVRAASEKAREQVRKVAIESADAICDNRDPIEMARAAGEALKGAVAA